VLGAPTADMPWAWMEASCPAPFPSFGKRSPTHHQAAVDSTARNARIGLAVPELGRRHDLHIHGGGKFWNLFVWNPGAVIADPFIRDERHAIALRCLHQELVGRLGSGLRYAFA
jgi:hypothetical protein